MTNTDEPNILKGCSPYEKQIPKVPLHQYVLEEMMAFPDRVVMVDLSTKKEWKSSEILEAAQSLATGLQSIENISKGDIVAIALPNCAEYVISVLAVSQCGGIASLVNPFLTEMEMKHVTSIICPKLLICYPDFVLPDIPEVNGYPTIFVDSKNKDSSKWHTILESGQSQTFQTVNFNVLEDLVTLPFSSGTTGLPKGVMISHYSMVIALFQFKKSKFYQENETCLGLLPMYHLYGFSIVFSTLVLGSRVISTPKFVFTEMLHIIQDYQVTIFPLVPPIALMMSRNRTIDEYDLSSIKLIFSAAAPLKALDQKQLQRKLNCRIIQFYGMTETTFGTHYTFQRRNDKDGSIGTLSPLFDGKIVDQVSGENLGAGELGELCVRGPMLMKGYIDNPNATAETIDSNGWLHTGDVGYYDEDGWFYIVDRIKELIKYKGFQVPPSELESLLLSNPEVVDAAVIGVPDEMAGELPRAYVVKRPSSSVTEQDLLNFVDGKVSGYKKLRGGIIFTDYIPKSASGKILRRLLQTRVSHQV